MDTTSLLLLTSLSPKPHLPGLSSHFLGQPLRHTLRYQPQIPRLPRPIIPTVAAAVKRRKEMPFDNVIQRDKKLKLVLKIRNILVSQPERIMNLRDLGRFRRDLGLTRKRRFIALLKRFPGVFEIVEEGVYSLRFRLTPEAEAVYLDELRTKNDMEGAAVTKLRKLLMMSMDRRILIEKIAHLKTDLGLPPEFRDTICVRYPQYLRVVSTDRGPVLELTHWDSELAVSAMEMAMEAKKAREEEERNLIIDRPLRFNRAVLPKGLKLSRGEAKRLAWFNELPDISPYSDFSELRSGSAEKEKHACAVVHEMLSMTLEKRTLVDHFTHFREEFRFSQQLRGMLIRHPDMFYVSLKGDRDSVFLREAYHKSQLIEKHNLLLLKEKMRALVGVERFAKRGAARRSEEVGDYLYIGENGASVSVGGRNDGGEYSGDGGQGVKEMEDLMLELTDSDFEENENEELDGEDDDWGDEDDDDESPPDFDDGDGSRLAPEKVEPRTNARESYAKEREVVRVPVLPDGTPRERW